MQPCSKIYYSNVA